MQKEEIEKFLNDWQNNIKDKLELKRVYLAVTEQELKDCPKCEAKAVEDIRKALHKIERNEKAAGKPSERKHWLKPGNHQFAPGEEQLYNNENTTDEQIDWYVEHFPHIKSLLV